MVPPKVSTPLLVKTSQRKKHRHTAVNTTVSFKPEDEVEMIVQTQTVTGKIQEEQTESDDEISAINRQILCISQKNQPITKSHNKQPKISLLKVILKKLNILYFGPIYYPYFVTV